MPEAVPTAMFCDNRHQLQSSDRLRSLAWQPGGNLARWLLIALLAIAPVLAGRTWAREPRSGVVSRIHHHSVESRGLGSVGYSTRLRALEITFKRGGTYRYLDVPRSVYRDLLAAESKAGFYNRNIRGKYRSVYVRAKRP